VVALWEFFAKDWGCWLWVLGQKNVCAGSLGQTNQRSGVLALGLKQKIVCAGSLGQTNKVFGALALTFSLRLSVLGLGAEQTNNPGCLPWALGQKIVRVLALRARQIKDQGKCMGSHVRKGAHTHIREACQRTQVGM